MDVQSQKLAFGTKFLTFSENCKVSLEALRANQSIQWEARENLQKAPSIPMDNCCENS